MWLPGFDAEFLDEVPGVGRVDTDLGCYEVQRFAVRDFTRQDDFDWSPTTPFAVGLQTASRA